MYLPCCQAGRKEGTVQHRKHMKSPVQQALQTSDLESDVGTYSRRLRVGWCAKKGQELRKYVRAHHY